MRQKTKNLIICLVISGISLLVVFGWFLVAQAPEGQILKKVVSFKMPGEKGVNSHLATVPENQKIEFIFGGDVMLSRQVNAKIMTHQDYSWPFLKIADFLNKADFTVVNLESPFVVSSSYEVPTGSFLFKANPESVAGLSGAGVDLVSLANNHILNQGAQGLTDSFKILAEQGIKYVGAGQNLAEAHRGEVVIIKGQKFGFLAYAYPGDASVAGENKAGIANLDLDKMRNDVSRLKDQGIFVIVMMHAGTEYTTKPNQQQIIFARAAIDAGAEAVIGHHPHWPQTFEFYQDKPIIYSLGNLVFDQMWSKETAQGLIARMSWQAGWQGIELIPVKIKDYGQVEIITDDVEKKVILEKIGAPADGIIQR